MLATSTTKLSPLRPKRVFIASQYFSQCLSHESEIGRKISVVAKNILRTLVFLQLHQQALLANIDMKRIVSLATVQIGSRRISLAKWRHPQIDKRPLQTAAAKAASSWLSPSAEFQRKALS